MKKYFFLFPTCVPVKGFSRSTVCNLQIEHFEFIPNILYEILVEHKKKSIEDIITIYGQDNRDYIIEYFDNLISKQMGFYTNDIANLIPIKYDYKDPFKITNAIIDYDKNSNYDISKVILQLNDLFCPNIELRLYSYFDFEKISQFLSETIDSPIRSITLYVAYGDSNSEPQKIKKFLKFNKRVKKIIIHSSPFENKLYHVAGIDTYITCTNEIIDSEQCCGNVSPSYFTPNIHFFTETQVANSCLNKKVSIDKEGNIKNCPSMAFSYGNTENKSVLECIDSSNFKELWSITKDQISVCKDCEFRYICHDCRAYRQNESLHSKPLKCKYNPYEAIWE